MEADVTMYMGMLKEFIASSRPQGMTWPPVWTLKVQLDRDIHAATTTSRIVLAVLETALLKRDQWKVELEIAAGAIPGESIMERVRVQDDRVDHCTGTTFSEPPAGIMVRPFTPTAFADEKEPKWGFFFCDSINKKYGEYKGTSLDVYVTIERAWYEKRNVVLTFDGNLIVDAA